MSANMFDTLKYVRRLRGAGVSQEQAEAHADALADALGETVATKSDIEKSEGRILRELGSRYEDLSGKFFEAHGDLSEKITAQSLEMETMRKELSERINGFHNDLSEKITTRALEMETMRKELSERINGFHTDLSEKITAQALEITTLRKDMWKMLATQTLIIIGAVAGMLHLLR